MQRVQFNEEGGTSFALASAAFQFSPPTLTLAPVFLIFSIIIGMVVVGTKTSTGTHNFYCAAYTYVVAGDEKSPILVTVLSQCINRNTLYGGVYEEPAEWRLVGSVDIRVLQGPKVIEVRK